MREPMVGVLYGLPTAEAFDAAERGQLVIGGCEPRAIERACGGRGWPLKGLNEWREGRRV